MRESTAGGRAKVHVRDAERATQLILDELSEWPAVDCSHEFAEDEPECASVVAGPRCLAPTVGRGRRCRRRWIPVAQVLDRPA